MTTDSVMKRIRGVKEDAERQQKEFKDSDAWLQDSVNFNPNIRLNEKNKTLANQLFDRLHLNVGTKQDQKRIDFEVLIVNLLDQFKKPVTISLNQNDWKYTRYNKSSYFIVELIEKLHQLKLINMKKGYYFQLDTRLTRIWPTDKLLECFPEHSIGVISKPNELVILHDEKGKLKEYDDTRETWRIRSILSRVNEVNSKADIKYLDYKLYSNLVSIFKERFTWYGRLHTKGYRHYQGFSGEERAEFTINGDPIIEKDYRGLHPYLLYASEGFQYYGDPYSVIDKRPEVRLFLKITLLAMINAKSKYSAKMAMDKWLRRHPEEKIKLSKLGITNANPFIDEFFKAHQRIAHLFCKGKDTGMRIMNKDSKIALDVINYFAKKNIPILSVHDSFIVQYQYEDELVQVMRDMYKKHTGFRIKIG